MSTHAMRSVLWIGPASGLAESGALDQPTLDITWVPDVGEALDLKPSSFDVEILDAVEADRVLQDVKRLRRGPRRSEILVRLPMDDTERRAELLAARVREVVITADGLNAGADLLDRIDRLAEEQPWQHPGLPCEDGVKGVIGRSPAILEVLALVQRARNSNATVLLLGETGSGKEVIARRLHDSGPRAARPFVAVNCAAFPDSLLESELFGYVRGAFTKARRLRQVQPAGWG